MKAYVDAGNDSRDPDYHNLKQGLPVQQRKAQALHRDAGVPEGPCVIRELQQFQAALPGYQLKVVSIDPPHIDSSKRVNIMTGAIHSKVSSTNPTSATIVIVGTITTTLNIISATVNGAPLATAKADRLHCCQTTPGTWKTSHTQVHLQTVSQRIIRRRLLRIPSHALIAQNTLRM